MAADDIKWSVVEGVRDEQDAKVIWITESLQAARKCRHLHPDFLRRIAFWAAPKYRSQKEALRAAKRKIHQVHGAYLKDERTIGRAYRIINELGVDVAESAIRETCQLVLALHASSKERLEQMEEVFETLWSMIDPPSSVLDIACGLNPFALPWMHLPTETRYQAFDVDCKMIELVSAFLSRYGKVYSAQCCDVVTTPPTESADVALFLKSFPCFEQQDKGSGFRVLEALNTKWIIVSFPARTLGGRRVGMERHYAELAEQLIQRLGGGSESVQTDNELFYVIDMRDVR